MEKSKKAFEDAQKPIFSGVFRFSSDYITKFQLFQAVSKLVEKDKRFLYASIRSGGSGTFALDFRYDLSDSPYENDPAGKSVEKLFKPMFRKALGLEGEVFHSWDYSSPIIVIK